MKPPPEPSRDTHAWVEEYLQDLRAEGYAYSTLSQHRYPLERIAALLNERGPGLEWLGAAETEEGLGEWVRDCTEELHEALEEGWTPTGSKIRRFVSWARQKGYLPAIRVSPSMPPLVEQFLDFCTRHRGLAVSTVRGYRRNLLALSDFLRERGRGLLPNTPLDSLDTFLDARSQTLSRDGLADVVCALRGFLKYLFLIGEEHEDRSGWLEYPTTFALAKLPRDIEDAELAAVLDGVDRASPAGKRDWAILMLMMHYGLRPGEVAGLCLEDVDFENQRLLVEREKGGPRQGFPLLAPVAAALREYLEVRPQTHHPQVFLRLVSPLRPLTRTGLSNRIGTYFSKELQGRFHGAYALRHTLARKLRQNGAPLPVISRLLGHRHPDSTASYIRIAIDELREVADNYAELL